MSEVKRNFNSKPSSGNQQFSRLKRSQVVTNYKFNKLLQENELQIQQLS